MLFSYAIAVWADGWAEGEGGLAGLSSRAEGREKVRGEYGFRVVSTF